MAIALVRQFNTGTSTSTTTLAVPAAGVASGDILIVSLKNSSGSATVTDSKGNTYTAARAAVNDSAQWGQLFYSLITTPLVSGDSLTFSVASFAIAAEFSGVVISSPVDQAAGNSNVSGTITGSNTATLTGTTDLYIALIEKSASGATLTDTTSGLADVAGIGVGGGNGLIVMRYAILSSTTAVNYAGVLSSGTAGVIVATFLAAAVVASGAAPYRVLARRRN